MTSTSIKLRNLFAFPATVARALRFVLQQKHFINKKLKPVLSNFRKYNDGSIDEKDFRKITHYYGFGVPGVLGEFFALIRGTQLSPTERWASTSQGAITGLFDDFFDKRTVTEEELYQMIHKPEEVKGQNMNEELFLYFYREVLSNTQNRKEILELFQDVFKAQIKSVEQEVGKLSKDEITHITYVKGGKSVLFYRMLLSPLPDPEEEAALYCAGALMQLGNDIFDVYKDAPDHIDTLLTTTSSIDKVRQMYLAKSDETFQLIAKMNISPKRIRKFCHILSLGMSRCLVALDQHEQLEKSNNGVFNPNLYSRKELICDMEKPINLWRSFKYYINYRSY